ncbi:coiled-coil domain-containing protein 85C-like isoform X1 [Styela clava]
MNFGMDGNVISPSSCSSSSSSTASSSPVMIRGDGLPPYGSNAMSASARLPTDDELRFEGVEILIQRLRACESEHKKLLSDRGRVMKDVNRRLQVHLLEVRSLRDINQKLQQEKERLTTEKDELGGMCCFLDDDRDKAKKMAREWQVFGRYATGVLQKELSQCHGKIRDLEQKQQTLLSENRNLKELCLLLDQEQAGSRTSIDSQSSFHGPVPGLLGVAGTRDSGDGSSNGSTASNSSPDHRLPTNILQRETNLEGKESYVRYLENKVRHLEDEVKGRLKKAPPTVSNHPHGIFNNMSPGKVPLERRMNPQSASPIIHSHSSSNISPAHSALSHLSNSSSSLSGGGSTLMSATAGRLSGSETTLNGAQSSSQKSDPLVYAMKVLELHDQLDNNIPNSMYPSKPGEGNHLDEQHKEIVREMCNVVWRKLGDNRGNNGGKPPPQSRGLQHRTASVSNL